MTPDSTPPSGGNPSAPDIEVELRPEAEPWFTAIVSLRGEHDTATADAVSQTIGAIAGSVLVDLSDCTFIDSAIIHALLTASSELEREGRFLEIVAPAGSSGVGRTLDIVRMRDRVVVHHARPSHDPGRPAEA